MRQWKPLLTKSRVNSAGKFPGLAVVRHLAVILAARVLLLPERTFLGILYAVLIFLIARTLYAISHHQICVEGH